MGAVSDVVLMGDWRRMRMWLLAIAVAMIGANLLHLMGLIDLTKSIYPRPRLLWLSHILGGLLFGVGMTLASGCASKTLIRIGNGSLKALIVFLVMGIAAYMTLRGLLGVLRVTILEPVHVDLALRGLAGQDLMTLLSAWTGAPIATLRMIVVGVVALVLVGFVFKDASFRATREYVGTGIAVGILVTAGFFVSGHWGYGEDPNTLENAFFATNTKAMESFSFVAPAAFSLELLMFWSDKSLVVTYGIAATIGMVAGSALSGVLTKRFRWEAFASVADMRNHLIGAILMGFGGVTALGCTIGQGVSGLSTLALGSIITFVCMVTGAALTMKYQYWRFERAV